MNYISKMKEFDQIFLPKRLFAAITGHLCLTKGHLDIPEGQVGLNPPYSELIFHEFHLY